LYGRETNRARQKNSRSRTVKSPDSVAQTRRPAQISVKTSREAGLEFALIERK